MSWFRRARRALKGQLPPQRAVDDWAAGDTALCVAKQAWFMWDGQQTRPVHGGPRDGQRYLVTKASMCMDYVTLQLAGFGDCEWDASSFRKAPPSRFEEPRREGVSGPREVVPA